MTDLRTAAQQALEALGEADTFHRDLPDQRARRLIAMTALRAALAQAALVAAAEREACAKVAEWTPDAIGTSQKIAAAIRARSTT